MVFFSVENPAGFSIKSKDNFSYKKTPMYGIFLSVEKPAGFSIISKYHADEMSSRQNILYTEERSVCLIVCQHFVQIFH